MKSISALLLALLVPLSASATAMPGFRVRQIAATAGFASSVVSDSRGTLYYTTTAGDIFRLDGAQSTRIAHVPTQQIGDSGLLGMALRDDRTAVVHYTRPKQTEDVVASIDLVTGEERLLHAFTGDISLPGRETGAEHHGGNPTVGADGNVYVAIGDFGTYAIAALPEWNAGKVFRIAPDGTATQFARGFRNPFDLAWDDANKRIVLTDNGQLVDDEVNIVHEGDYCGWPYTAGDRPPIDGAVPPRYTFPIVVAPTGLTALTGANAALPRGYLIGTFVTRGIYWIPNIDLQPLPAPIPIILGETSSIIDVTQAANGDVFFATGNAIYQLVTPARGDCNGDGLVDAADASALASELNDGNGESVLAAPHGAFAGTYGCDVNRDGVIDTKDAAALAKLLTPRVRVVRAR